MLNVSSCHPTLPQFWNHALNRRARSKEMISCCCNCAHHLGRRLFVCIFGIKFSEKTNFVWDLSIHSSWITISRKFTWTSRTRWLTAEPCRRSRGWNVLISSPRDQTSDLTIPSPIRCQFAFAKENWHCPNAIASWYSVGGTFGSSLATQYILFGLIWSHMMKP